ATCTDLIRASTPLFRVPEGLDAHGTSRRAKGPRTKPGQDQVSRPISDQMCAVFELLAERVGWSDKPTHDIRNVRFARSGRARGRTPSGGNSSWPVHRVYSVGNLEPLVRVPHYHWPAGPAVPRYHLTGGKRLPP